ncbi:hypothetical protein BGX27_010656 [Mortierella sp. AM989]|nr:hypothetical protein BGX27_010656 [Mortierella sp. AM989]
MSSFNPNDPFDNGQQWQNVPSNSAWSSNIASTTQSLQEFEQPFIPEAPATPLIQPTAPTLPHTTAVATTTASTPSPPPTTATIVTAIPSAAVESPETIVSATPVMFEDLPPSYEAAIIKDRPQIHDNYDHLRGPVGQRGVDIKTRIPLDSTPASHYQSSGGGSGGAGGSSSRPEGQDSNSGARYGSISPPNSSSSRLAQPSAPNVLHGQVSQGREDDDLHSRDVDRLLGPSTDHHGEELEEPESHWGIVGDGKAWMGLAYLIVILFPWALFCFVWTLVTGIVAAVTMIVPPIGYLFLVTTITSWRALARADLVVSRSLVEWNVRERYPHTQARIFIPVPPSQGPQGSRRSRSRRSKNMWHRGSEHLKATVGNKHSISTMFYFLIWKFIFALVVFPFILVSTVLTVPFMICLLPTLLIVSRKLINGQFRWAVLWLTEKSQPIALP